MKETSVVGSRPGLKFYLFDAADIIVSLEPVMNETELGSFKSALEHRFKIPGIACPTLLQPSLARVGQLFRAGVASVCFNSSSEC